MRKIVLTFFAITMLVSCKKENTSVENKSTSSDSTIVENTLEPENTLFAKIPEFSVEKVSHLVQPKKNDTLYVTNFFATWCGPCRREMPHFKEKMESMKDQPVKFTFVSLDNKTEWETEVKYFGDEYGITSNIVLLDGSLLGPDFFSQNFKTWDGGSIPFTVFSKNEKSDEFVGMMTKEQLESKIAALN